MFIGLDLVQRALSEDFAFGHADHRVADAANEIHVMFDHHEVVLSNGSWTESFQPGDMSLKGVGDAQRNEILELFPDLRSKEGIQDYQSARRSLKKHEAKLLLK